MTEYDSESPFRPVVRSWLSVIERSAKFRESAFDATAWVCRQFFDGSHDFMYSKAGAEAKKIGMVVGDNIAAPTFQISLNRIAELVQVFGPTIYSRHHHRNVVPRQRVLTLPQLQLILGPAAEMAYAQLDQRWAQKNAVAGLQSTFLNYLAGQMDLKGNSLLAIDEALITGRGVLWHEMHRPGPSSPGFVPFSHWGSCDDLFGDADGDTVSEWTWCAKREEAPRWLVEREYGLRDGALRKYARGETSTRQGLVDTSEKGIYRRKQGLTADTVTIYKVWSKCGLGHELAGPKNDEIHSGEVDNLRNGLSRFGDHVFLVLCEGCMWPLNVPPEDIRADGGVYTEQEVWERTRWPVPFYEDSNGWPFSELDFHPVAKNGGWPMAHFKPALGEMMAANWIYSFLMGRLHFSSRTLLFYADHINEDVRAALESGRDLELVPYQEALVKDINQVVQQFQHHDVKQDLWRILSELNELIDKRTGLTEFIYGMTGTQMRSAEEARIRDGATNIRPAAMADKADDWQSKVAAKEGLMARWKVPGNVLSRFMGEAPGGLFGQLWDQFCYVPLDYTNADSLSRPPLEFEYTVAAGSSQKPNLDRDRENLTQIAQVLVPIYQNEYMQSGDPSMLNSYIDKMNTVYQMDTPLLPDRRAEMMAQQQQIDPNTGMPIDQGMGMDPSMGMDPAMMDPMMQGAMA